MALSKKLPAKTRLTKPTHTLNASDRRAEELGWEVVNPTSTLLKQIAIDDGQLTYTENGNGELLILVHGDLGDYRAWSRQKTILARQYHVISYSRRYHRPNSSADGAVDYTYRRHVDDLISLIGALELGPAHLVGHSYGAGAAALVAMEHPELVSSLILGEPPLFSILSDPMDKLALRFHGIALNVVQKLIENGEQRLALREYINIITGKDSFGDLPPEELLMITQNAHTLGPMLRTFFESMEFDRHRARNIKTPTLIVTGEFSPAVYRSVGRELNRSLPNSELLTLAGASHGLQMENPAGFIDAVLEFLSQNRIAIKQENN